MKKIKFLVGVVTLLITMSCTLDENSKAQENEGTVKNLASRCWDCDGVFILKETPWWRDNYGQVHVGEGCISAYSFCDPRPIINPSDGDGFSKFKIRLISSNKLLVSCFDKVELTDEALATSGVSPNYFDQVRQNLSNNARIEYDEFLPQIICERIFPEYSGQTVIVKQGMYPVDYSSNPNGEVEFDIEIQD